MTTENTESSSSPPTSKDAWKTLIIAAEIAWVAFAIYTYIMGLKEGSEFESLVENLWALNIVEPLHQRIPYECCNRWDSVLFGFYIGFPALVIGFSLLLLRWVDINAGFSLLERIVKFIRG